MCSKVSSDWLPSYIKATLSVLEIFKMAGYFLDSPRRTVKKKGLFCFLPRLLIVSHSITLKSSACVIVPKNGRFLTLAIHIIAPVLHVHQNEHILFGRPTSLLLPYPSMHVTPLTFQFLMSMPLSTCSISSISTTDDNSYALVKKCTCRGKIICFKF